MKLLNSLAVGALALASIGTSFGALSPAGPYDVQINIVGSTAFRSATYAGIEASLPGYQVASNGALPSANQATFTATVGGKKIVVRTSFSGSVGGLQAIHGAGTAQSFLDEGAATNGSTTATSTVSLIPNIAMSDSSQAAAALIDATLRSDVFSVHQVGVIPFRFVASPGSGLTNMTDCGFRSGIIGYGVVDFYKTPTAVTAYDGTPVFFIGRNNDSGTRLVTFACTGFGIASLPYQFALTTTGGTNGYGATITAAAPYTPNDPGAGNGGYTSGGTVAKLVTAVNWSTFPVVDETGAALGSGPFITYLGETDSTNAINNGAVELTYNGVKFSYSNVENGSYQLWSYEYLFDTSRVDQTWATTLSNNIQANAGVSGIALGLMHVTRTFEGYPVSPL